jgi:hypothetical protein
VGEAMAIFRLRHLVRQIFGRTDRRNAAGRAYSIICSTRSPVRSAASLTLSIAFSAKA